MKFSSLYWQFFDNWNYADEEKNKSELLFLVLGIYFGNWEKHVAIKRNST